jgi:hypothetical protein
MLVHSSISVFQHKVRKRTFGRTNPGTFEQFASVEEDALQYCWSVAIKQNYWQLTCAGSTDLKSGRRWTAQHTCLLLSRSWAGDPIASCWPVRSSYAAGDGAHVALAYQCGDKRRPPASSHLHPVHVPPWFKWHVTEKRADQASFTEGSSNQKDSYFPIKQIVAEVASAASCCQMSHGSTSKSLNTQCAPDANKAHPIVVTSCACTLWNPVINKA